MTGKLFTAFALLLAAVNLTAGAGIASDTAALPAAEAKFSSPELREKVLALFISALLEKDPEKQCAKLIDVIGADPDNAETPFEAFVAAFGNVKNPKPLLEKFDAMHKKHPAHPLVTLHALALHRACGATPEALLKKGESLLSLPPAKLINTRSTSWEPHTTVTLLHSVGESMLKLGKYKELAALYNKWLSAPAPHALSAALALADCCHTAAARAYAATDSATGKLLESCFNNTTELLKNADKLPPNRKRDAVILLFYTNFKKLFPKAAVNFARSYDQRVNSSESNLWLLSSAVDCGSIMDLNKAAGVIAEINPRFNAAELRFKAHLNAGNVNAAQKELSRIPEGKRFEFQSLLYTSKKDWKSLAALIDSRLKAGTPPDLQTGIIMLTLAEKLSDIALFRRAEKIVAPHLDNPGVANAVGYISTELGIELPRARKLLTKALEKEPDNAAYLDSMAWVAFKEKRYAEAEKWISKAFANMNPREGVAVIFDHAGDIAAAQGKDPLPWYHLSLKYAPFDNEFDKNAVLRKMKGLK